MQKSWTSLFRRLPVLRRSMSSTTNSKDTLDVKEEYLARTAGNNTFNEAEAVKFRSMAATWWDVNGVCKPLHSMNKLRVELIRDGLVSSGKITCQENPKMLGGLKILDVGCGGGILSESLARLGADVTGLDAVEENVQVARDHALQDDEGLGDNLTYVCSTVERFFQDNQETKFDAVVASEVIEHVDNQPLFVQTCSDFLAPRGSLFVTTINRNQSSYFAAIVAAESVLGLLPKGTHDWEKFVTPEELDSWLRDANCQARLIHGMFYFPVFNCWTWIPQSTVNYAIHAIKNS